MLLTFGMAWAMPWLLIYSVIRAVFLASRPAALFLAAFACAAALPAGQYWKRFPHAVFPMGFPLGAPQAGLPESGLPAMPGAVATILLRLPILKHLLAALGSFPADREELLRMLRTSSVVLSPEGVAGTWCATRDREVVYLKRRLGFVRVAIQAGADLVPVYHLGCSQLLEFWGSEALSRRCRVCCGFFFGRCGLPLPRCHPIITLVGAPVPVVQCDAPSEAQVAETHARFAAALVALFDALKHSMGPAWASRTL
ncbi:hypothetical protein WJX81_006558 [Elliptochloris bilobata]|uniref:Acyltransferase n=1 Tax=Elliptochloris bilobata TaxID=381761 RepID=A0AAW1SL31_9CHLO